MQTTFKLFLSCLLCLSLTLLSGCGGGASGLVGKWELEDVENGTLPFNLARDLEFFSGGGGFMSDTQTEWSLEGNRLTIVNHGFMPPGRTYDVRLSRSRLTIIINSDTGHQAIYRRAR